MKRVLLAFALLAAVAAGCVLSIMTEKRTTDLLIDMTDRIEEAFDAEEFDRALTLTEEFTEEFTKRTKHFTFSCGIPTSPKSRKTSSPSLSSWKPETTSIFQPNSPAAATSSISSESSNSPASIISYKNRRNGIAIWKYIKIGDTKNRVSYLYITIYFKADGLGRSVDYRLLDRDFPGQEPARDEQQHHSGRQVDNDRPYPQAHLG